MLSAKENAVSTLTGGIEYLFNKNSAFLPLCLRKLRILLLCLAVLLVNFLLTPGPWRCGAVEPVA